VLLPPNPKRYAAAHRALHAILAAYAPVIEPRSYGHAYLDLTGTERLFGRVVDTAKRIEQEVTSRLRLGLVVGVAGNKLVSEAAALVAKREVGRDVWPVTMGGEAPFLAPEPVALLPEVPDRVRIRLDEYHLERIGEVADVGENSLQSAFGREGKVLHRHALGIDPRPVISPEVRAAYHLEHVLATDTNDRTVLHRLLRQMCEVLGHRLRHRGYAAGRLIVSIRHSDDSIARRSCRLAPCLLDADLWRTACTVLDRTQVKRVTVRSVAVKVEDLQQHHGQFELWDDPVALSRPKAVALQRAIDQCHAVLGRAG
jgi:DNA polymerase-4